MKKSFWFSSFLLLLASALAAQSPTAALVPLPNHIEWHASRMPFTFGPRTVIAAPAALAFEAGCLQRVVKLRTGFALPIVRDAVPGALVLALTPAVPGVAAAPEGYTLAVDKDGISLTAATAAGIYYAVATFDQLLLGDVGQTLAAKVRPLLITDAPRFGYRALMLDPARHFLPVDDVKFYIDQMAKFKYNTLQLHLTDDQGWRMEIKKHPKLTPAEAGAAFYTQAQLKDLVAYAALRHVEIIPEIDIPGHTVAILAAYPELCCSSADTIEKKMGRTVNLMLCASNPKVYDVMDDILAEVADVFPSKRIHLGGDEAVVERNWGQCSRCRALQRAHHYAKPSGLMNVFFAPIFRHLAERGKQPVLWCELDNIRQPATDYLFDYPPQAVLVTWRNGLTPTCIELTRRRGNALILAPGEFAYFDYRQLEGDLPEFNDWGVPVLTLEQSYRFDPGYGLPAASQAHLLGVSGTLWGEAIPDINRALYMTYPRALSLAEAGWTQMEHRRWDSFKERIYPNLTDLMKCGVFVRVPFEIVRAPSK
ncbi:MAG: beta-N-acetylhexosaminidase [Bacteroides sp.]